MKAKEARNRIRSIVGSDNAERLFTAFAGETIYITSVDSDFLKDRNSMILAAYQEGARAEDIARMHSLSPQQVRSIIRGNGTWSRSVCCYKRIVDIVGWDGARDLMQSLPGVHVYVPVRGAYERAVRDKELLRTYLDGVPPANIARKYRISVRAVYKILSKTKRENEKERDK